MGKKRPRSTGKEEQSAKSAKLEEKNEVMEVVKTYIDKEIGGMGKKIGEMDAKIEKIGEMAREIVGMIADGPSSSLQ